MTYKGYLQWPSAQELENLINKHGSFTGAAKEFGCDAESMRLKAKKLKLNVKVRPHKHNKISWPNDEELIRMIYAVLDFFSNLKGFEKVLEPTDLDKIKNVSKEDMKNSSKEWKWIYVVKESK